MPVESATGIGSWTLPFAGGFAEGVDLALGTDQAVLGYELAKEQGLGLGDTLLARGVPLQVVGIRRSGLAFPGSDAGRRVYVTFDTLERVLDTRDLQKRITLLVPSAESQEIKELFLREVAARLRVGQVETIDDRLGEIVLDYPGVWTITAGSSTVFPLSERIVERFKKEGFAGSVTVDSITPAAEASRSPSRRERLMIKLFQFAPAFGLPNASPFCMKLETYLRMAGLPFQLVNSGDGFKAPKRKLPYIDDGGTVVADSGFIIDYLKGRYGDPLDDALSPLQRALATAFQRLFEDEPFMAFAKQLRPLVKTQANQLLLAAPWGPHP